MREDKKNNCVCFSSYEESIVYLKNYTDECNKNVKKEKLHGNELLLEKQ